LPTPDQILEELADKVAAQIDRLAPVAFDNAYREMVRYHRFLLALNASRTPDGGLVNYAEVPGYGWQAPHRDWIHQYARLYERAAGRIPDEPRFIRTLARTSIHLLPSPGDPELPASILNAILDLGPMMMHRLEAWVTKRTTIEAPSEGAAEPRLALAGSDAKAYANILPDIIGAWESLLQNAPSLYKWRGQAEETDAERWSAFRASWPFLWQHLSNTAYCLAVGVWNEDEVGAALFREALVRWPRTLGKVDGAELRWRRLLFPDILNLDWSEASRRAAHLGYETLPAPAPDELFASVLRGVHDDVVLLTAALMLFWTINKKQSSDLGGQTAKALLLRQDASEQRHSVMTQKPEFHSLFSDILRTEIAGQRFDDKLYGAELDRLVQTLDNMTERRVVPGRVYIPSTLHERDDLLLALVAILAATTPNEGDDGAVQRVAELAQHEEVLPQGDRTLRNVVDELARFRSALEETRSEIGRGVALLAQDRDADRVIARLREIFSSAEAAIEAKRLERLKVRPVDPGKLERIRSKIEAALLKEPAEVPFFRSVQIERGGPAMAAEWTAAVFSGIEKAHLVEPPLASPISNFEESFVSGSQRVAERGAWIAFVARPRTQVEIATNPDQATFWRDIAALVEQVGPEPILVVSHSIGFRRWHRLQYGPEEIRPHLRIEQRPRDERGSGYIATIEGVDVFQDEPTPGVSWLFSARALQCIQYAELNKPGSYVEVAYELGEEMKGTLRVRFRQSFAWSNTPTFEIRSPVPDDHSGG
jgi:hypothetical protein